MVRHANRVPLGKNKWLYPDGLVVSDAHTGNVILMKDGSMIPIDLHIDDLGRRVIDETAVR